MRGPFASARAREQRMEDILHGRVRISSFTRWCVEKQMIVLQPEDDAQPRSQALIRHGEVQVQVVDFSWPRVIRVTITNDMQVHLVGDAPIGNEEALNRHVVEAGEHCAFLNAHEVR